LYLRFDHLRRLRIAGHLGIELVITSIGVALWREQRTRSDLMPLRPDSAGSAHKAARAPPCRGDHRQRAHLPALICGIAEALVRCNLDLIFMSADSKSVSSARRPCRARAHIDDRHRAEHLGPRELVAAVAGGAVDQVARGLAEVGDISSSPSWPARRMDDQAVGTVASTVDRHQVALES